MDNCSLFIMSCDSYSDVWDFLFDSIKEYWNDCPYPIYLCTETKNYRRDDLNIKIININNKNWGYRLIEGLKRIPDEYVFLLLDDLFPGQKVDQEKIDKCLNRIQKTKEISCIYLSSDGDVYHNRVYRKEIKLTEWPRILDSNYRLNATPGFWKKERLISYSKKTDSPWIWEVFGTLRIYKYKDKLLTVEDEDSEFPFSVICPSGAIVKGKWNSLYVDKVKNCYPLNAFNKRGIANIEEANKPLTMLEKIQFLLDGYRACGLLVFVYIFNYLRNNK